MKRNRACNESAYKKLIWYDHIKKMNDERLSKIVFNYETIKKTKQTNKNLDVQKTDYKQKLVRKWTFDQKRQIKFL